MKKRNRNNPTTEALRVVFAGAAVAFVALVGAAVALAVLPFAVVGVLAYLAVWAVWTWASPEVETARAWIAEFLAVPTPAPALLPYEFPSYVAAGLEESAGEGDGLDADNVAAANEEDVAVQREFDFGEDLTTSLDMVDVLAIDLFPDAVFEDEFDFEPVALPLPGVAFAAGEDAAFVAASLSPEPYPSRLAVDDDEEEFVDPREEEFGEPVGVNVEVAPLVMASAAQKTEETSMSKAIRLVAEGSSVNAAAKLTGVPRSTLQAKVKKLKASKLAVA